MEKLKKFIKYLTIITLVYLPFALIIPNYLMINGSESMPEGIYRTSKIKEELQKGDVITLEVPRNVKEILYQRKYLGRHTKKLIKTIGGVTGDRVEVKENKVYINSKYVGKISTVDPQGRKLTSDLKTGVIPTNKIFVSGITENSYDSKYFGLISEEIVLKKARLIYEFKNKEELDEKINDNPFFHNLINIIFY